MFANFVHMGLVMIISIDCTPNDSQIHFGFRNWKSPRICNQISHTASTEIAILCHIKEFRARLKYHGSIGRNFVFVRLVYFLMKIVLFCGEYELKCWRGGTNCINYSLLRWFLTSSIYGFGGVKIFVYAIQYIVSIFSWLCNLPCLTMLLLLFNTMFSNQPFGNLCKLKKSITISAIRTKKSLPYFFSQACNLRFFPELHNSAHYIFKL